MIGFEQAMPHSQSVANANDEGRAQGRSHIIAWRQTRIVPRSENASWVFGLSMQVWLCLPCSLFNIVCCSCSVKEALPSKWKVGKTAAASTKLTGNTCIIAFLSWKHTNETVPAQSPSLFQMLLSWLLFLHEPWTCGRVVRKSLVHISCSPFAEATAIHINHW